MILKLSFLLSTLFMGFLAANIFGIVANSKNIIFLFVVFIEFANWFVYSKKRKFYLVRNFLGYPLPPTMYASFYPENALVAPYPLPLTPYPEGVQGYRVRESQGYRGIGVQGYSNKITPEKNYQPKQATTSYEKFLTKGLTPKVYAPLKQASKMQKIFNTIQNIIYNKKKVTLVTIFNFLKIGIEFGFFIDAFKLGS